MDKSVKNYTLDKIEERRLFISVSFTDTEVISNDMLEADTLIVNITLPEEFVDAKINQSLSRNSKL